MTGASSSEEEILDGKIFAVLAYLSIFCIIPLVLKKENPFALAHGKQGLVLFVGEVGVLVVSIPLGVWFLKLGLFLLLGVSFLGIIEALRGRYVKFPWISEIAEKITL